MPTMEGYEYADRSHELTIQREGFIYETCHNKPRPVSTTQFYQNGWTEDGRRRMVEVTTYFVVQGCPHLKRDEDPGCQGCVHRSPPSVPPKATPSH